MALNRKTFKKAAAGAAADTNLPSGYFNTVTYTGNGSTQRIGGYINRGAVFNGSSSYIDLGNSAPFGDRNDIKAISGWIKTNGTTDNSIHNAWLYSVSGTADAIDWFYVGYRPTTNSIQVYRRLDTNNYAQTDATITPDTNWHHIVVQLTATEVEIYLDGQKLTTTNTNAGTGSNTSWISYGAYGGTVKSMIGKSRQNTPKYYDGLIDQVRIFNKALSSGEVTTLYGETHASTTISTTDIFDDNSGVALYQLDGNANDTGGVSGYIGEGAIFNGSSSVIKTPAFGNTYPFTYSVWINPNSVGATSIITDTISGNRFLFGTQSSSFSRTNYFLIGQRNQNHFGTASNTVVANTWSHVVLVATAVNSYTLYIDGVSQTLTNLGGTMGGTTSYAIGANGTGSEYFNGFIDQVRIYDKALSSSEVSTLYGETASSNITISDLVAYYPMEGTSLDQEGSYHGTDTNVEYNYNGTASNVTYQEATNFSPDLVWVKCRSTADPSALVDSVRGANWTLFSDNTNEERNRTSVTAFDSNGFTLGNYTNTNRINDTYVAWCFNAGTDAAASNTDGNITSTVKANQDAGFSIVKFAGGNSSGTTVGHGLTQPIELLIVKNLNDSTDQWITWHKDIEQNSTSNNTFTLKGGSIVLLNSTSATIPSYSYDGQMGSTGGENLIAYCFHSVDGIQKVGSYTSAYPNTTYVETGFEPAFVMIKSYNQARNWCIHDNKRKVTNSDQRQLYANLSSAEADIDDQIEFTSNGFTIKGGSNDLDGGSSYSYIYLAIAADPDTTTPTVEDSFEVVTYTGNGGTQEIDTGFKPDLVWIKDRDGTDNHALTDSVRGTDSQIFSNLTNSESTDTDNITSFDSNGFSLGNSTRVNSNGEDHVAWCWKAGDHDDNLPQINTEGTIDSVVSVNDAAGFSIVKWTGTGAINTIGHGLSSAPELIMIKCLGGSDWQVYAEPIGNNNKLALNTTSAASGTTRFDSTSPTSSVFTFRDVGFPSQNFIAYCFTSITGYQKIGSYTGGGEGSSNEITTGFKPRWVMVKRTDNTGTWRIYDHLRGVTNDTTSLNLSADSSGAESTPSSAWEITFADTGFYWGTGSNVKGSINATGGTYIYLAIK